jgi:hypothetical protein
MTLLTIAQRFNAGVRPSTQERVPFKDERSEQPDAVSTSGTRFLPSLMGLGLFGYRDPALKRWAIVRIEEALNHVLAAASASDAKLITSEHEIAI